MNEGSEMAYVYEPIEEAGQIRLLHLQPGVGDVHFTLSVASLTDKPIYEALSYCWGDPKETHVVYCHEKVIRVATSLYTALRQLRHVDEPRVLWADAVCINQGDDIEKSSQVAMMSDIYANPSRVIIWLGDHTADLDGLNASITEALEVLPAETHDATALATAMGTIVDEAKALRAQGKPNLLDINWVPIANLLTRPWFSRKWIIQEVTVSGPEVPKTMVCGDIEVSWADVARLAFRMGAHGLLDLFTGMSEETVPSKDAFLAHGAQSGRAIHSAQIIWMIDHYRSHATLLDAVLATATFSCTNPKDHIYALLSLTPNNGGLKPRYDLTVEEVFKGFAAAMLVKERNLKLLGLAPHVAMSLNTDPVECLRNPSWVPDLSHHSSLNQLVSYSIRPSIFSAGGTDSSNISISEEGGLLYLKGYVVDTVQKLADSLYDMSMPAATALPRTAHAHVAEFIANYRVNRRPWIEQCQSVASHGEDGSSLDEVQRRRFAQTMMCGMIGMRDTLPETVLAVAPDFIDHVFGRSEEEILESEQAQRLSQYVLIIEPPMIDLAAQRRFCRTANGRYGQVRREARVGDLFCVITGAEVPYVIRPTGKGTYTLIGDCFLTDVMQGEALKPGRYEATDIVLE